jgi:hypothetical protein
MKATHKSKLISRLIKEGKAKISARLDGPCPLENSPAFIKKMQEAREMLDKYGLPKF